MRTVAVVAVSILTLIGSLTGAEARGFRLRGFSSASSHGALPRGSVAVRPTSVATVGAIDLSTVNRGGPRNAVAAQSAVADETAPIPPMPPAPATVAVAKPAEPWCRSGRVAGSGTGFCLIN